MKNEKLMRAMGEIDEDLILEAREERRPRSKWIRWSALAACLALVMLCAPVLITVFGGAHGADPEHEAFSPETDAPATELEVPDKSLEDQASAIDHEDLRNQIAFLKEQLEKQMANQEASKEDFELPDSVNQNFRYGFPPQETTQFVLEKSDFSSVWLVVYVSDIGGVSGKWEFSSQKGMSDWVIIYVEGERVSDLPDKPGTYEVTVDLSPLLSSNLYGTVEYFEVVGRGEITIKEDWWETT